MGIYRVKPWFRGRLRGTARLLAARGVSADQVTGAGLAASALGGLAFVAGRWWALAYLAVPLLAFCRIAANALDGLVAEEAGSARPAGELFNETADRLGDAAFCCGAAAVPGVPAALALGALAAATIASFEGIAARAAGGTRRYDGPMGKPDRMLVLGAAALVAPWLQRPATAVTAGLALVAAGAAVTTLNRYRRARRELDAPAAARGPSSRPAPGTVEVR